jgi:hypothetical protein
MVRTVIGVYSNFDADTLNIHVPDHALALAICQGNFSSIINRLFRLLNRKQFKIISILVLSPIEPKTTDTISRGNDKVISRRG